MKESSEVDFGGFPYLTIWLLANSPGLRPHTIAPAATTTTATTATTTRTPTTMSTETTIEEQCQRQR